MNHFGDPCIHCGIGAANVPSGPCADAEGLAATHREVLALDAMMVGHIKSSAEQTSWFKGEIAKRKTEIARVSIGIDLAQVALAETVMFATDYSKGGAERESARQDAITWFATGKSNAYRGLQEAFFGTKNYDRWSGQRSDHEYGCGPSHGSTCFQIGLKKETRKRDLTPAECEACVYYLVNLERIQQSKVAA